MSITFSQLLCRKLTAFFGMGTDASEMVGIVLFGAIASKEEKNLLSRIFTTKIS
jgi:hypothetical protein